jgi:hypothetical protein
MDIYVEDCCKSYCAGCPWAEEQKRLDKEADKKRQEEQKPLK